jgi:sucrose-6-phosphate hydrolase SacC (GH32 family)
MLTGSGDDNNVTIRSGANRTDLEIQEGSGDFYDVINPPFQLAENEDLTLRLFIDKKVVELFANDRQAAAVFTYEYLREDPNISIFTKDDELTIREIKAWKMKSIYKGDLTFY